MFATLGLKAGDVIVEIDGHEISAADAAAPFQGLAADASMTLTIERSGQMVTLNIANGTAVTTAKQPVT